jgi:hypothetical protein
MPVTDAEYVFLDAYVHEVYTPSMTGPHTRAVRGLGANQSDLAWLRTAWHSHALATGKSLLGSAHPESAPLPWSSREDVLSRGRELREEFEGHAEPARPLSG